MSHNSFALSYAAFFYSQILNRHLVNLRQFFKLKCRYCYFSFFPIQNGLLSYFQHSSYFPLAKFCIHSCSCQGYF
nr:MAG TPA: hypothetical protein [Caudoviricetes sp.]